jgi:glycine cleavage system T protein (aminomethyltransferase)
MAFDRSLLTPDFGDSIGEAAACRNDCALFDFSFLEAARIEGKAAAETVERFSGRSVARLAEGEIRYAVRIDPAGHALADLTIWRTGSHAFEVMSGRREDIAALLGYSGPDLAVTDLTPERAVFAAQGPGTLDALRKLGPVDSLARLRYFTFAKTRLNGIACLIGRLGYTGEAGFEIIAPRASASQLWKELSRHLRPAGFVAADMLRVEAGFVLFANEFRLPVAPAEAGLGKFFPSPLALAPQLRLVSFRAEATGLSWPWQPSPALQRPEAPGIVVVTSACNSIAAGGILGLGYAHITTPVGLQLHDPTKTFRNIRPTSIPFYDVQKRRPRAAWRRQTDDGYC